MNQDTEDIKKILKKYEHQFLHITTGTDEKQVFIQGTKQKGLFHFVELPENKEIAISSITKIRKYNSKKILYPTHTEK